MKMSAFGDAFSAVMRVCRSPAAASGSRSIVVPGYAALNASPNWLFVVSFSAEYTVMLPVGLTAAAAGAFAGWRKGFVVPLVVQAGALLSLGALYAGPLQSTVPSGISGIGLGVGAVVLGSSILGAVGGVLIRLVYRFGVLQKM